MKRSVFHLMMLAALAWPTGASAVDDRPLYPDKAYPGVRCKYYGLQSDDTFMGVTGTRNALVNNDSVSHYAVCPVISDLRMAATFSDAEIWVRNGVTCSLYMRQWDGSSTSSYPSTPEKTRTDTASGTTTYEWCGTSCGAFRNGPDAINAGATFALYCRVPPGGEINGYLFREWNENNVAE
jgi:hypothetical protein